MTAVAIAKMFPALYCPSRNDLCGLIISTARNGLRGLDIAACHKNPKRCGLRATDPAGTLNFILKVD